MLLTIGGHAVSQLVDALRYKTDGRSFETRGVIGPLCGPGSTQSLTKMSTRNFSKGVKAFIVYG